MSVIEELRTLSKVQIAFGALLASMTAVGGAAVGYKYAVEQLKAEADKALEAEIHKVRDIYEARYKQFTTPEEAFEALHPSDAEKKEVLEEVADAILKYQGNAEKGKSDDELIARFLEEPIGSLVDPEPEDLTEVAKNVFTDMAIEVPADFDYEKEIAKRDPDHPYIITKAEFGEAEFDYEQPDFVYYEGDGVLSNIRDEAIAKHEVDGLVGNENLLKFGYGAEDENMLYVRNVRLGLDCSIERSPGKYSIEVGGDLNDELMHSDEPIRRFRQYRD